MSPAPFRVESDGAQIACFDLGGSGQPAILLHGLYGAHHEWTTTAAWLSKSHHVFAIDQRGHGESSKGLDDLSLDALAADVLAVIDRVGAPVLLLGQSMGALVALIVAGRWPELVSRLILVEVNASGDSHGESWLSQWPPSFQDLAEATTFFEHQRLDAATWVKVLEEKDGVFRPSFSPSDMLAIEDHLKRYDYRAECARISAPTLVVAGAKSWLDQRKTREVAALIAGAKYVEVDGAGHDVHLDAPDDFRRVVQLPP